MWRLSTAVLFNSSYAVEPSGLHRITPGGTDCNVVLLLLHGTLQQGFCKSTALLTALSSAF